MSWHWSRLAILSILALLYLAPLSSGDKGLWLSVTSMPVRSLGPLPGEMPSEHLILLPDAVRQASATPRIESSEPDLGLGAVASEVPATRERSERFGCPTSSRALDKLCQDASAPRGPPS